MTLKKFNGTKYDLFRHECGTVVIAEYTKGKRSTKLKIDHYKFNGNIKL